MGRWKAGRRRVRATPPAVSSPLAVLVVGGGAIGCSLARELAGRFGRSLEFFEDATILSTTSIPVTTSPKAVYWLSRNVESFTTMKNCDDAELGSCERAIETIPRLCDVSLNSAFRRASLPPTTLPPVPYRCAPSSAPFVFGSPPWIMNPGITR